MGVPPAVRAAAWAALLSGAPSTLHALATGRDPLEATLAAGSILLPRETRRTRLLAAAVPVHLALSLGWAVALDRAGVRGAGRGALAGLAIGAVDLSVAAHVFPRDPRAAAPAATRGPRRLRRGRGARPASRAGRA